MDRTKPIGTPPTRPPHPAPPPPPLSSGGKKAKKSWPKKKERKKESKQQGAIGVYYRIITLPLRMLSLWFLNCFLFLLSPILHYTTLRTNCQQTSVRMWIQWWHNNNIIHHHLPVNNSNANINNDNNNNNNNNNKRAYSPNAADASFLFNAR